MSNVEITGLLLECASFAAEKHKFQKRKGNNASYIIHPLGVALSLYKEGKVTDLNVLQAAILHDTVEDTNTTFEEIELNFGSFVRKIVEQVTDDKKLSKEKRKQIQIEHAPHLLKEAKLVKLSDKLYNLRDLMKGPTPPSWDAFRIQGYFVWAKKVVEGLRGTNEIIGKCTE